MEAAKTSYRQRVGFFAGIVLAFPLLFISLSGAPPHANRMAAVAVLMAVWWITEAIPIPATALVPVVAFPALGIMRGKEVSSEYINQYTFLFIGGFMIALGLERWGLHKRIALKVISIIGSGQRRIVLGFMAASAFLSMWISNTATTMMMLPIGLSVISLLGFLHKDDNGKAVTARPFRAFPTCLMLGIAYGASIGGISTLVGTPPNLSFVRIYQIQFPEAAPISFQQWFAMAFPLSLLFLLIAWAALVFVIFPFKSKERVDIDNVIIKERNIAGGATVAEKR
ncbi:MAG: SLC13/DASS family transporter, partial [Candidatus Dadabacteria bacterium]